MRSASSRDAKSGQGREFAAIVRYYRDAHRSLEETGAGSYRLTSLGAWATSRAPHLFTFFKKIGLKRCRLFVDLGSGDGIVVCVAALFTQAIGIEADPDLCRMARQAATELNFGNRVSFICGDYLTQRIQHADCLYLYPDKPFGAVEALLSTWTGTLLVYGPHFPPQCLKATRRFQCGKETLTLYRKSEE